jgi:hypothetical protein
MPEPTLQILQVRIMCLEAVLAILLEQEYPASAWNAEHIEYEIRMGNGSAPLVKVCCELLGTRGY